MKPENATATMTLQARQRPRPRISELVFFVILIGFAALMLFPFLWMILTALKTSSQIARMPPTFIPRPVTFEKFEHIFSELNFARYAFNSLWLAVVQIIGTVLSSATVAFALAKLRFPGRKIIIGLILATMMLPSQVTMIPTYFVWLKLGLVPSFWPLILPSFLGGGAFNIFLFHQMYRSMPHAMYESASIDGAHPLFILLRIYLPLVGPVIATVVVFAFMGSWNNTLGPLLYLARPEQRTLVLALLVLQGNTEFADFGLQMAAATLTILPTVVIFAFAQRYFVEGISNVGVKG